MLIESTRRMYRILTGERMLYGDEKTVLEIERLKVHMDKTTLRI